MTILKPLHGNVHRISWTKKIVRLTKAGRSVNLPYWLWRCLAEIEKATAPIVFIDLATKFGIYLSWQHRRAGCITKRELQCTDCTVSWLSNLFLFTLLVLWSLYVAWTCQDLWESIMTLLKKNDFYWRTLGECMQSFRHKQNHKAWVNWFVWAAFR